MDSFAPAVTNFPSPLKSNGLTEEEKIEIIALHMGKIMETLGLDLTNASLQKTPERIAKMYVQEVFAGLDEKNFPAITLIDDPAPEQTGRLVAIRNISFSSFCEHHFVPMIGKADVAYIPSSHVIGLSKINRIVRYFAARPQLQERLTHQIHDCLKMILGTEDVAVSMTATHHCVALRGVQDDSSSTFTYALGGQFSTDSFLRTEFFSTRS